MLGITPHAAPPPPDPAPARRAAAAAIARARRRKRAQLRQAQHAAIRRHGPQDDRPPLFRV
jgi:hypothetical protein